MVKSKIKNIPLFSYYGNKDNEIETIMQHIPDMNDIDIVIEPYCGSFALTRYILTNTRIKNIYVMTMMKC